MNAKERNVKNQSRIVTSVARSADGATIVEFALIAPLFFLVFFAILELGMYSYHKVAIEAITASASREASIGKTAGGPCASTTSRSDYLTCLIQTKAQGLINGDRVIVQANSIAGGGTVKPDICLDDINNPSTTKVTCTTFKEVNGSAGFQGAGAIQNLGNAGELVQINITYPWKVQFPIASSLFGDNGVFLVSSSTVIRNEPFAPVAPRTGVGSPAPAPIPLPPPPPVPVPVPAPVPEPTPVPAPVPEPTPVPAPVPEPTPVPAPVPEPTPVPAPVPEPTPVPAPVPEPTPVPAPVPEPAPAPSPTPTPVVEGSLPVPSLPSVYDTCGEFGICTSYYPDGVICFSIPGYGTFCYDPNPVPSPGPTPGPTPTPEPTPTPGGGGGGGGCFVGDVLVSMADGTKKRIADIKYGEKLVGSTRINNFIQPETHMSDEVLYGFNGERPFVTGEHQLMTTKGWRVIDPKLALLESHGKTKRQALKVGDRLVLENGDTMLIKSIDAHDPGENVRLYNPGLDGDHTYYVNGILVHNIFWGEGGGGELK